MTTVATLLEALREVDFETWNKIYVRCNFVETSYDTEFGQDFIQGCIQRAIEARGWEYVVSYDREARQPYGQIGIPISNVRIEYQHRNYADTPAAAILAAYIEAVRESR